MERKNLMSGMWNDKKKLLRLKVTLKGNARHIDQTVAAYSNCGLTSNRLSLNCSYLGFHCNILALL